jgi:hypothetical protein
LACGPKWGFKEIKREASFFDLPSFSEVYRVRGISAIAGSRSRHDRLIQSYQEIITGYYL